VDEQTSCDPDPTQTSAQVKRHFPSWREYTIAAIWRHANIQYTGNKLLWYTNNMELKQNSHNYMFHTWLGSWIIPWTCHTSNSVSSNFSFACIKKQCITLAQYHLCTWYQVSTRDQSSTSTTG